MPTTATHEFVLTKTHGRETSYACTHCGCVKVVKADASILYRKPRRSLGRYLGRVYDSPLPCVTHTEDEPRE